jgi:hypothetical protein
MENSVRFKPSTVNVVVERNMDFILMCLRQSDEGTKTLVSQGNLNVSWGILVPSGNLDVC